jgi:hypothetical protein
MENVSVVTKYNEKKIPQIFHHSAIIVILDVACADGNISDYYNCLETGWLSNNGLISTFATGEVNNHIKHNRTPTLTVQIHVTGRYYVIYRVACV